MVRVRERELGLRLGIGLGLETVGGLGGFWLCG